jgi:hypothetical protein
MEANTVILNLGEYNSLRDFRDGIEKGHTYYILEYTYCGYTMTYKFVSPDDAVKLASEINDKLMDSIKKLEEEIINLKHPKKDVTIDQVKQMSIVEFIKWKRKQR